MHGQDWLYAIVYGCVQGITEFLPVSSSAHLEIVDTLLGRQSFTEDALLLPVIAHAGTLTSLLMLYWREWWGLATGIWRRDRRAWQTTGLLLLSAIPAAVAYVLWGDLIEAAFQGRLTWIGVCLLLTGVILVGGESLARWRLRQLRVSDTVSGVAALGAGLGQALALFPGISRAGTTIAILLGMGVARRQAVQFALMMAVIPIGGALLLEGVQLIRQPPDSGAATLYFTVYVVSAATGWLAARLLQYVVVHRFWHYFALYCAVLGGILIGWSLLTT